MRTIAEHWIDTDDSYKRSWHPAHAMAVDHLQNASELAGSMTTSLELMAAMELALADEQDAECDAAEVPREDGDGNLYRQTAKILIECRDRIIGDGLD